MVYVIIGALGFLAIHLLDIVSLKRMPWVKPLTWISGTGMLAYAAAMASWHGARLSAVPWLSWIGWAVLPVALLLLVGALFVNLPFRKTYVAAGVGDKLVTTGLYALVRHPGVHWFVLLMLSLFLISQSATMLLAALVWSAMDIALVVVQDKFIFGRMFADYANYQRQTPMLIPNKRSIGSFTNGLRSSPTRKQKPRRYMMSNLAELLRQSSHEELWQRCCGFIDLSLSDFMMIQRRLLLEQVELLKGCQLGRHLMNGATPETLEEFRSKVPLSTYVDYAPYLLKRNMSALPRKPILWQCTSGKSGDYAYRWVPVTTRQLNEIEPLIFALLIFATGKRRNEVVIRERDKVFYGMAPPPYATGTLTRAFPNDLFDFLPPIDEAEKSSFEERIQRGFELALSDGLDVFFAMSSLAVATGERFKQKSSRMGVKALLKSPRAIPRLARAMAKSKLGRRPLLPKDMWSPKGLITFGIDGSVYREKIKRMWGRYPLDFHGCTEAPIIAMQTWDHQGMTFVPNLNFLEFIPEEESLRSWRDPSYQPRTLLANELKPGNYELVITSFHGGPFVRYKLGHLVKITSLRNEELNIDIPQMTFLTRIDDQIDIAGFTRLSEKVIWQAIENTGLAYAGWAARKEVMDEPVLHLYIEPRDPGTTAEQVTALVHEELKKIDVPYAELESFAGLRPLRVTLLPQDAFLRYKFAQQVAGADLTQLKPPHINPSDAAVSFLLSAQPITAETKEAVPA